MLQHCWNSWQLQPMWAQARRHLLLQRAPPWGRQSIAAKVSATCARGNMRRTSDWTDVADHPSVDPPRSGTTRRQSSSSELRSQNLRALFRGRPATPELSTSFFNIKITCWKRSVFCAFHLWSSFKEHHFVLNGPTQNERNGKSLEMRVDLTHHKHSGNSCVMEPTMEAWCFHW